MFETVCTVVSKCRQYSRFAEDENGRFKDISESDMFMIYTTAHNPSDSSEEEFPAMIKKKKAYMMKK